MEEKRVTVEFENEKLKRSYEALPQTSHFKKQIDKAIKQIKEVPGYGQPISHKLIPKEYKTKGFDNVFYVRLNKEWRLVYSLIGNGKIDILAIILEWFDSHKGYERRFKY
jgi:Txe/YoeB family toxin of Txe-Axe toxin-antitoxin module